MNTRHMHAKNLQRADRDDECMVAGDLRMIDMVHYHRLTKRNDQYKILRCYK